MKFDFQSRNLSFLSNKIKKKLFLKSYAKPHSNFYNVQFQLMQNKITRDPPLLLKTTFHKK